MVYIIIVLIIVACILLKSIITRTLKIRELQSQIRKLNTYRQDLLAHHTLEDVYRIHTSLGRDNLAWNRAICPDEFGMFRTSSIETMQTHEVYLGNINGIWTNTLYHWMHCADKDTVSVINNQYYRQVLSGINAEIAELEAKINSHSKVYQGV